MSDKKSKANMSKNKLVPDQTHLRIIEGIMDRVVLSVEKKTDNVVEDDSDDWSSTDEEDEEMAQEVEKKVELENDDEEDDDEDEEEEEGKVKKGDKGKKKLEKPLTTKNEILPEEGKHFEFEILPTDEFVAAGTVFNIVRGSVIVVEGVKETEPLRSGTVLCTSGETHQVLGEIDELFGPVSLPYYIMRNVNQTRTDLVKEGEKVVAVMRTRSVVDTRMRILLQKDRGTDASNMNDEEAENKEFSDDEEEREFKKRSKRIQGSDKRKRVAGSSSSGNGDSSPAVRPARRRYVHPRPQQQYHPRPQHQYHPRPQHQYLPRPRHHHPQSSLPYHLPPTQFSPYQQYQPYGAAQQSYQQYQYGPPRPQYQPFGAGRGYPLVPPPQQQYPQQQRYQPYAPSRQNYIPPTSNPWPQQKQQTPK